MRELMQAQGQPAALLHRPENFLYLSGYAARAVRS